MNKQQWKKLWSQGRSYMRLETQIGNHGYGKESTRKQDFPAFQSLKPDGFNLFLSVHRAAYPSIIMRAKINGVMVRIPRGMFCDFRKHKRVEVRRL